MKPTLFTILILLSILSVVGTVGYVTSHQQAATLRQPFRDPPKAPAVERVAGAGVVESASQNLKLGSFVPGIVSEVAVAPGRNMKTGELLFKVDSRTAEASVSVAAAAVKVAEAQLAALKAQPRAEDIPISESAVASAEALVIQQTSNLRRQQKLKDSNASSKQELDAAIEAADVASEQLKTARAQLVKLKAGAWQPDIDAATATLGQSQAALDQARVAVEQCSVNAPIDGEVLQVNVRVGEYVSGAEDSLIVFGDTSTLNVRVDIDEVDIPRFQNAGKAIAYRRGDAEHPIDLTLSRIEPLVIPKQTLTGETQERTDTRVLQVIFQIDAGKRDQPIYVGQQLDVFAIKGKAP
jgi:multidrug resistance efflux pump